MTIRFEAFVLALSALALHACGDPEEAPRVALPVVVDPSGLGQVTTNLGYEVDLTEARVVVEKIAFTIAGEAHTAALWPQISSLLIPAAHAHPGHFQGGDVTGELRGRFVLDWAPGGDVELGTATLVVGTYQSAQFTFVSATAADGIVNNDVLFGHTAVLRGRATQGEDTVEFLALIDSPAGRQLVGAPFEFQVRKTSRESLGIRLVVEDPLEGDTLFDGLDFAALDADGNGHVAITASSTDEQLVDAYNLLRRTLQTHDHFDVSASTSAE